MTRRVTIRDLARAQIVEAFNRYNLLSRPRGDDFLSAVDARIEEIVAFPFAYSILWGETRRVVLKNFSYVLLYTVREYEDETVIVIVACVHERSDSQTWRMMSQSE